MVVLQLKGTAKYNNTLLTLIPTYLKTDCLVACKKRCVESVRIRPSSPPRVVGLAGIRNQTSQGHGMGCHHTHANFHPARNFKKGVYEMLWLCVMAVLNNAMFDEH